MKLAQAIFIELGPARRLERALPPLEWPYEGARELCASRRTREWLCRPGGVIDKNIQRLNATQTDVEAEDALFHSSEFTSIDAKHRVGNGPEVQSLIDDLDFKGAEAGHVLANYFNEALPFALQEVTGLSGAKLRDIFDSIRKDLKRSGQNLALFIEDVSVMSALDKDVFHAVEPQSRPELCDLVAVLGMTVVGKKGLRDNEADRVSLFVEMQGSVEAWRESKAEVRRFAARYLNAMRLSEDRTRRLVEHRQAGGDINDSGCRDCPVIERCHKVFGAEEFEGQAVGLFPFSPAAPQRLLQMLDTEAPGLRKNQRGFLDQVLKPLLGQVNQLDQGRFPDRSNPFGSAFGARALVGIHRQVLWRMEGGRPRQTQVSCAGMGRGRSGRLRRTASRDRVGIRSSSLHVCREGASHQA